MQEQKVYRQSLDALLLYITLFLHSCSWPALLSAYQPIYLEAEKQQAYRCFLPSGACSVFSLNKRIKSVNQRDNRDAMLLIGFTETIQQAHMYANENITDSNTNQLTRPESVCRYTGQRVTIVICNIFSSRSFIAFVFLFRFSSSEPLNNCSIMPNQTIMYFESARDFSIRHHPHNVFVCVTQSIWRHTANKYNAICLLCPRQKKKHEKIEQHLAAMVQQCEMSQLPLGAIIDCTHCIYIYGRALGQQVEHNLEIFFFSLFAFVQLASHHFVFVAVDVP